MVNACLFSGGKDSTLALHKAIDAGIKIDLLITMKPSTKESYMFHYPNVDYASLQAEALGMDHVFVMTEGKKEEELKDLEKVFVSNNVKLLVTGATYSKYQADRINKMAKELGMEHFAPLWHIEPMDELNELADRFNVIMTAVAAEGLDETFLGKRIDKEVIERLEKVNKKFGINMLFEGGEAESFVVDAPLFKKRVNIIKAHVEKQGINAQYIIDEAVLSDKL